MTTPTRATTDGRAYLAQTRFARQFVLKGGVLLAAFGERRPTRDIDGTTRQSHRQLALARL